MLPAPRRGGQLTIPKLIILDGFWLPHGPFRPHRYQPLLDNGVESAGPKNENLCCWQATTCFHSSLVSRQIASQSVPRTNILQLNLIEKTVAEDRCLCTLVPQGVTAKRTDPCNIMQCNKLMSRASSVLMESRNASALGIVMIVVRALQPISRTRDAEHRTRPQSLQ